MTIRRTITVDEDLNKAISKLRADYMRKHPYHPDIDFTNAITQLAKEGLKHITELQGKNKGEVILTDHIKRKA